MMIAIPVSVPSPHVRRYEDGRTECPSKDPRDKVRVRFPGLSPSPRSPKRGLRVSVGWGLGKRGESGRS